MSTKTSSGNGGFKTIKGKVEYDGRNLKVNGHAIPMRSISMDGWANLLTGLGIKNRDKNMSGEAQYNGPMQERMAEELNASDSLAKRITNLLPFEGIREWIKFVEPDLQTQVDDEVDRLQARKKFIKAWQWARLYGGSAVFINNGDPIDKLKEPLDLKNLQEIKSLLVFNRHELQVDTTNIETDISNQNFDMPMFYNFMPRGTTGGGAQIHESRLIRFDGVELPTLLRVSNQYWGDSVYTALYDVLRDFGMSCSSVAHLIQEFRMLVYSVDNLAQDVVAGNGDAVSQRMNLMNLSRSVLGAFALDKNGESMESMTATVTGLSDLVDVIRKRLQSATDIPHTILFNESPSGLSSTGKSEERMWYDYVASQQEHYLAEKLDRFFEVVFAAKAGPFKGTEPPNWAYDFVPLWQLSEKEQADVDKLNMETDSGYIDRQVVNSSEVREERKPHLEQMEIANAANPEDTD